jgi:hypothetical protein
MAMKTRDAAARSRRKWGLILGLATMIALDAGTAPAPANEQSSGPRYSIAVVEGESTLPEDQITHTSAIVHPKASLVLSIVRGGTVVARDSGEEGVWLSQVPQIGDVLTLESPAGKTVGSVVYDGLPSLDPAVCAGSTDFSGQRSAGEEVQGGYYTLVLHEPYGVRQTAEGKAQVTLLSGTSFGGSFLAPLQLGQTVWASEQLQTPLEGGATFTYESENDRPVGACPQPPAPPPPPPPPALQGSIFSLAKLTLGRLLHTGLRDRVTINQPGTISQELFQAHGKLPAFASKRHHRRSPAAILIARGTVTAGAAGTVEVTLRLTAKGRRLLRHARSLRAVLLTTLRNAAGSKIALERRIVTFHR